MNKIKNNIINILKEHEFDYHKQIENVIELLKKHPQLGHKSENDITHLAADLLHGLYRTGKISDPKVNKTMGAAVFTSRNPIQVNG